jgi:hypothetical protein
MKFIYTLAVLVFIAMQSSATKVIASSFGYNATNATTAFQNAINNPADTTIVDFVGNGEWKIDATTFFNLAGKTILFEANVKVIARSGFTENDNLFRIRYCNGVKIIGNNTLFKMQKAEYTTGEFRHCIAIVDCDNVEVSNITAADSGGDGVFIAAFGPAKLYSENIILRNIVCDNNRRQGISVISVKNLLVEHCIFKNTNGTLPEAGVDFEPDHDYERLENIVFKKCNFTNNYGNGIALALINLSSTSVPVDITFNDCYLSQNHQPSNTYARSEINANSPEANFPTGTVTFNRCLIENSQWSAITARKSASGYSINFNDCVFKNVSQQQLNFNNPIWLETLSYAPAPNPAFGGVSFNNQVIEFSSNLAFLHANGWTGSAGLANVTGNITVVNSVVNLPPVYSNVNSQLNVTYTYNFVSNLPTTTVNVNNITANFYEGSCNKNIFTYNRSSATNNLPLPVQFSIAGLAVSVADYFHIPNFAIIPAGANTINDTLIAIDDAITEPAETVELNTTASSNYTVGNGSFSTLLFNGACNIVLPVKFLWVNVKRKNNIHQVSFSVANETNNTIYVIERSADGSFFEKAGTINIAASTANTATHVFIDAQPLSGINYYRIKQVENNKFYYSATVSIKDNNTAFAVYPNPVGNTLYLTTASLIKSILIFNDKGQLVKTVQPQQNNIDVADLHKGAYLLKINLGNEVYQLTQFIKL